MANDQITMSWYNQTTEPVLTDAYVFKPVGRLKQIQRGLWWALRKFGSLELYWSKQSKYKRINFSSKTFADNLTNAYSKCFSNRERPSRVFIGPGEFEQLAYQPFHGLSMSTFDIPLSTGYTDALGQSRSKIFNLPVTVVPHMNGVLII